MVSSREKLAFARRRTYRAGLKKKGIAPDMSYTVATNPMESRAGV